MTPQQVTAALEAQLLALFPATPIAWPGTDYEPTGGTAWMRAVNRSGQAFAAEMGTQALSRRTGAFIVQCFAPDGGGAGEARTMAAGVEAGFRRDGIGGVECGEAYTEDLGSDGRGWYQCNVIVPWWAWIGE